MVLNPRKNGTSDSHSKSNQGRPRRRERVGVHARERVMLEKIGGVAQMPPAVWLANGSRRKPKDHCYQQERAHDGEREDVSYQTCPGSAGGRRASGGGCICRVGHGLSLSTRLFFRPYHSRQYPPNIIAQPSFI